MLIYKHEVGRELLQKKDDQGKRIYHMGGSTYYGVPPAGYMPKPIAPKQTVNQKPNSRTQLQKKPKHLYLIDGDNNFKEATQRLDMADSTDKVQIYVSQRGLFDKLKKRKMPHVEVIYVKPGPQAVDNRILEVLESEIKSEKYEDIFVISRDKGYEDKLQEYRCRYKKKKSKLDRREMF